ncbi:pentatricopeptide repeat-containing protein At1g26460, mitochondrial-like isoform X2 [Durio zibethinus]|uniref:Pentatricopeptide repeat-containing protein At1g26460, mitochondrial-like isoform X2 n=1 Tax=Durio zibethinus TaxID=66656 RepID=A0A6P5XYZ5_DURZI|nr:pentatricopeptide repeat-containing protein At1g26460, mitochondrial-like isoform X2 [Durio zibethinus]
MASQMAIFTGTRIQLLVNRTKCISTFPFLSQEPQLTELTQSTQTQITPLPPNPASGSPLYHENWRNPNVAKNSTSLAQSLIPLGFLAQTPAHRIQYLSQTLDAPALMNHFADWMTKKQWTDVKQLFEFWVRSLDKNGKPNKPDVNLYNHYLRANLMMGASAGDLLDLVTQMDEFAIVPNTVAYNLVLKAMNQAKETEAAKKLLERMLQGGTESLPDDESYDLVIGMLFGTQQIDAALKYVDMALKFGCKLSTKAFTECVWYCINQGQLDNLVTVIERCKTTDRNKALYPNWNLCNYLAEVAMQADNSKLAFYALEFLGKWIAWGEIARPPLLLSVDEGLIVSALATAGRTYSSNLLDMSWVILRHSLRQKKVPSTESFLGKIYAHASLGNLQKAFATLHMFEAAHGNSINEAEDSFSPFTSLYPLVVVCSKKGFETLDSTFEASRVFEHMLSLGVKPNAKSYSLLVDAHLINRDQKAALSVIEEMVTAGFIPSKETLKKVRRRCIREMDYECDDQVESLAKKFSIRMGSENRRGILFDLDYGTEYAS